MNRNYLLYLLGLSILLLIISIWLYSNSITHNSLHNSTITINNNEISHSHNDDEFHIHADFLVVLNGTIMNFSREEFMSKLHDEQHSYVHLHDMKGNVIHFHKENISLEEFFTSINMVFNQSCFVTHENISYCENTTNDNILQMYVNGSLNENMEQYVANDMDQILIIYGNYTDIEIQEFINLVSDEACIYSMICEDRIPEGGLESSCATGSTCLVDLDFLQ
ncbi:MAG: hypothetical protein LAT82_05310 [Nanoarchaeota archaeon]|nr:hypothetical protein [Nanoarchaeota archaeon]